MPKITECYMFICQDNGPENEGVPAFLAANGMAMPLVCADKARVDSLMAFARDVVRKTGKPIRLVRFSVMEELGEVKP